MDKQSLALLIPIMALSIPVLGFMFAGFQRYAKLRLEETRLKMRGRRRRLEGRAWRRCVSEMDDMRRELGEVQERLDFAERLLARPEVRDRPSGVLPEQPR